LGFGSAQLFCAGIGLDPSRMLSETEDAGWAAGVLAEDLGMLPPAFIVSDHRGGEPRSLSHPGVLGLLRADQVEASGISGVRGVVGWVDFVLAIQRGMGRGSQLPEDRALIEQYLLMFHRPADTRSLASTDLEVAVSLVTLRPGGGPQLAKAAASFTGKSGAALFAGDALEMMLASRLGVQRSAVGLLALLVLFLGLGGNRGEPALRRAAQLASILACLVPGLAVATLIEGVVTPTAALGSLAAGGLIAASWSWGDRAALIALGLGGASAFGLVPSSVLGLRALGLLLLCSCVMAWVFRAVVVRSRAPAE
jgi:hypothetical protein